VGEAEVGVSYVTLPGVGLHPQCPIAIAHRSSTFKT
jgi:hypothetical protein